MTRGQRHLIALAGWLISVGSWIALIAVAIGIPLLAYMITTL